MFHIYLQLFARRELEISVGLDHPVIRVQFPAGTQYFLAVLTKLLKNENTLLNVCLSVRPSAWNSTSSIGQI